MPSPTSTRDWISSRIRSFLTDLLQLQLAAGERSGQLTVWLTAVGIGVLALILSNVDALGATVRLPESTKDG